MVEESLRLEVEGGPNRCPVCDASFPELGSVVACGECGSRHHSSCREQSGKCARCGSPELLVPPPRRAPGSGLRVARPGIAPGKDDAAPSKEAASPPSSSVPRATPVPPPGSAISVSREGDVVVLSWRRYGIEVAKVFVFCALLVFTIPLMMIQLYRCLGGRRGHILLGPDWIEIQGKTQSTELVREKRYRARPDEITSVRVDGSTLAIDVGVTRIWVATPVMDSRPWVLSSQDLSWLRDEVLAWQRLPRR